MDIPHTLSFEPALPCACYDPAKPSLRCEQPASVGGLDATGFGAFRLTPVCKTCAEALVQLYPEPVAVEREARP